MTTVGYGESSRYALRLYWYVLATVVLGAGWTGLGAALLWPEIAAWRGPGEAAVVPGVAGGVLAFVGLSILVTGGLAAAYKLVADAVSAGSPPPTATGDDGEAGPAREDPPEPSPSEIAFGEDGTDATDSLPGDGSSGDPLGYRSE